MRRYETIIILDPDISEDGRAPVFDRISDTISQGNGFLVLRDDWGNRKLAYEIKKKPRGFYTRFDFCGTGTIVDEIERFCRIDDRVMKYLTVLIDEAADVDKIKEEAERAESEKKKAELAKAQTAEETPPSDVPADVPEAKPETPTQAAEALTTEAPDTESPDTETGKEE
ncbi:MAG: 30S ribosomal protein S6 [Desulfobacterales bacterium]|nr:30S ribosomal protein S6 [Desulfobacterales bacterium]